ncbi:MAG: amidase family protein [Erysipelotrichaceae bacterium]
MNNKKTRLAMINPYNSVKEIVDNSGEFYLGVKDVEQIPNTLVKKLAEYNFSLHTLDHYSHGGRAIDLHRINPITGNYMSGSSSGSAINVFLGINDLAIGTDGGGSVLAPAISLNLYSFLSPIIEAEYLSKYSKISTDGIKFTPSIGFISKDYRLLLEVVSNYLQLVKPLNSIKINSTIKLDFPCQRVAYLDNSSSRLEMIDYLLAQLTECDVFIYQEEQIDVEGIGDTIYGHFDQMSQRKQNLANKGLLKVINMAAASAITIPTNNLSSAIVLVCKSDKISIAKMLKISQQLPKHSDELLERYFGDLDLYFQKGYQK